MPVDLRLVNALLFRPLRAGLHLGIDRRDPGFAWEMSLAVWLIVKGFKSTAITSGATQRVGLDPMPA